MWFYALWQCFTLVLWTCSFQCHFNSPRSIQLKVNILCANLYIYIYIYIYIRMYTNVSVCVTHRYKLQGLKAWEWLWLKEQQDVSPPLAIHTALQKEFYKCRTILTTSKSYITRTLQQIVYICIACKHSCTCIYVMFCWHSTERLQWTTYLLTPHYWWYMYKDGRQCLVYYMRVKYCIIGGVKMEGTALFTAYVLYTALLVV